ncbi:MAG: hypothetical protein QXX38_01825 [Candidatus Aenigmatarchaeota archaeon]
MLAQVSMEFISLTLILIIILLLVLYNNISFNRQIYSIKIYDDAQKICDQIAFEINLALKAGSGYSRIFYISERILNVLDYNITINNYFVVLTWHNGFVQSPILTINVTGDFVKGNNLIKNIDGVIYVNK